MSSFPQLTNQETAEQIAELLISTAAQPRPVTLAELLNKVKSSIKKMLRNGHTYADVVELLGQYEVVTTVAVVEAYHTGVNKVKRGRGKAKEKEKDTLTDSAKEIEITAERAEKIIQAFAEQAEVRKGLTKEELIDQLRSPIEKMLAAHYTYEDISAVMAEAGVQIAATTIKSYYQSKKKNSTQTSSSKKSSNQQAEVKEDRQVKSTKDDSSQSATKSPSKSPATKVKSKRLLEKHDEDELEKEFNL